MGSSLFTKVLIANRGAIARRIIRTLKARGIRSVAVYAEADAASLHVEDADERICLGDGPASATYLDAGRLLDIARDTGAQAIHPGYGFLSENAAFAEACEAAGVVFIGPSPDHLRLFGLKHTARALARDQGLPLLEGSDLLDTAQAALRQAEKVGYPVMLKSTAGGGGIGMRVCRNDPDLEEAFESIRRLGENNFADGGVFLENYIERARHLEVQIFGDGAGGVLTLGVRDCSVQRRNQKVIEETPPPNLPTGISDALCAAARTLASAARYRNAGTVEFVYDSDAKAFYFLEVNTRLQVEHGVTEQVWGVDLVSMMIDQAAGLLAPLAEIERNLSPGGHAVQARLYAEDPGQDFRPSPGLLTEARFPAADGRDLRIETWVEAGCTVAPSFDPMIAKVIVHKPDRAAALDALDEALEAIAIAGIETNRAYLRQILKDAPFASGHPWTRCLDGLRYRAPTVDVLSGGTLTTVQDWPGRVGYWAVGIPPSGPMDDRAFRLGNRLLGNDEGAAGLEITMTGPHLRFNVRAVIAVTGAVLPVSLDGAPRPMNEAIDVPAGSVLTLGTITGPGARSYLLVSGGFDVPDYMGSKSTFTLSGFGGHAGRALRPGDVLHMSGSDRVAGATLGADLYPSPEPVREIRVIYGPHGAPEYFTPAFMDTFFSTDWEVHFNSSRTGVRLIGPRPEWARDSGGEAGLHPSNIHDNAYAVGAVDFTGDMPVILGPDGPSLGGFVCPATVIEADLWTLGQLKAGDRLRFKAVTLETARALARHRCAEIAALAPLPPPRVPALAALPDPVLLDIGEGDDRLVVRASGDTYMLAEIGPAHLDLVLRFKAHLLMQGLEARAPDGIVDLTPGIRSLQVHFRPEVIAPGPLLDLLQGIWGDVCAAENPEVPSRIVYLPLSWDDPATRLAIEKYMTTVRKDAPWCPSNIDFIRRINGLADTDAVYKTVFEADYLVMGLGDVYLGAPVATPLDPRHRLVTTKYNPARTWTAENSVGIGGAYMCVYGMEGPGGYQFVGRTLQMWSRYKDVAAFRGEKWLLRFFDRVRFYPVSAADLLDIRRDFPLGRYPLTIEETTLNLGDYQAFLAENAADIAAFENRRQTAFEAERARWIATGQAHFEEDQEADTPGEDEHLGDGFHAVESLVAGNLWQVSVKPGQVVASGDVVAVLESMKMEIPLTAPLDGVVADIRLQPGASVRAGQCVVVLREQAA